MFSIDAQLYVLKTSKIKPTPAQKAQNTTLLLLQLEKSVHLLQDMTFAAPDIDVTPAEHVELRYFKVKSERFFINSRQKSNPHLHRHHVTPAAAQPVAAGKQKQQRQQNKLGSA